MKKIFFLCFLLCLCSCNREDKAEKTLPKILAVYSYHAEYPWQKALHEGISDTLEKKAILETFYMDTKRNNSEEHKANIGKKALQKVYEFKPQIVLTTDDNAQEYLGKYLVGEKEISIVFSGMNAEPQAYNYIAGNATGILERPNVKRTLSYLKTLYPDIKKLSILTDLSSTSKGFIAYCKKLQLQEKIQDIVEVETWEDWQKGFKSLQGDAILIYMYHILKDQGKYVDPPKIMAWTQENMTKPCIGFFDFAVIDGALLGVVESGYEHGELSAKMALEIMEGKKASYIPVSTAREGVFMINNKTAQKLNLDISGLKRIADKVIE